MYGDHSGEKSRFVSRLATLPKLKPIPAIGDWILVETDDPSELARKVNRRLAPGTISVPRQMKGLVRIPVREPIDNEKVFEVLKEVTKPPRKRYVS